MRIYFITFLILCCLVVECMAQALKNLIGYNYDDMYWNLVWEGMGIT